MNFCLKVARKGPCYVSLRKIFDKAYLDSNVFRQRKKLFAESYKEENLFGKYQKNGSEAFSSEEIQALLYSVNSQKDFKIACEVVKNELNLGFRHSHKINHILNVFFWICYKRNFHKEARDIFGKLGNVENYHVKNRYFGLLYKMEMYDELIEDIEGLENQSADDILHLMAAYYKKEGNDFSYEKAKNLVVKAHKKGRCAFIFCLYSIKQGQFEDAKKANDYIQRMNFVRHPFVTNLQIYYLLKSNQADLALDTLVNFSVMSQKRWKAGSQLEISMENLELLKDGISKNHDICKELIHDLVSTQRVTPKTVEEMVFTPINKELKNKER